MIFPLEILGNLEPPSLLESRCTQYLSLSVQDLYVAVAVLFDNSSFNYIHKSAELEQFALS